MKFCSSCKQEKDFSAFHKNGTGYQAWCKDCKKPAVLKWRREHPEQHREHVRKGGKNFYKRNPLKVRENALKRKYNIDLISYNKLIDLQNNVCAICKNTGKLHVDHDHITGIVRGLLCMNCNTGIGNLKDSPELLRSAINYLLQETPSAQIS